MYGARQYLARFSAREQGRKLIAERRQNHLYRPARAAMFIVFIVFLKEVNGKASSVDESELTLDLERIAMHHF